MFQQFLKIALVFLSALLAACGPMSRNSVSATLDNVESYINERPDSALTMVRAISANALRTQEQKARAALLHSIALDKCYVDLQTDSIIAPAVAYYMRHGSEEEQSKTFYYLGRIRENAQNYQEAIVDYARAENLAAPCENERLKGLIAMSMARIYQNTYNHEKEAEYREKGKQHFLQAGDTLNYYTAIGSQAVMLQSQDDWACADSLFSIALQHLPRHIAARDWFYSNYALMMVRQPTKNPHRAIELLDEKQEDSQRPLSIKDRCIYAYALALLGKNREANALLATDDMLANSSIEQNYWRYRIATLQGDFVSALRFLENTYAETDRKLEKVLSSSLPVSLGSYYKDRSEAERQLRIQQLKNLLLVILSIALVGLLVIHLQSRRRRKAEERVEALTTLSNTMSREIEDARKREKNLQDQFALAFKDQFKLLGNLCDAYWSPVRKSEKDKIYDEVKDLLAIMDQNTERQQELEDILNKNLNGIMRSLRKELPSLREQDYRLVAYTMLGLRSKTIAAILGYTEASVNTLKSRIRKQVSALDSANRDKYLKYL